jgi:transposase
VSELQALQHEGIRTVISDPIDNRRVDKLQRAEQRAVRGAKRSVKSKELLRRRGMHIERSFAHILDAGGMRRTTLRGWENLNKRFKLAAAFYNLSQLMRKLFGFGTPKQLAAAMERGVRAFWGRLAFILTLVQFVAHWITEMVARPQAAH